MIVMARLLGNETPRVFTPPLRPLTPDTSLGFDCIDFAHEILGMDLFPWQKWLLIHVLELRDDGLLRFRKVIVLVARQNGKTLISEVLALYFMFALKARMILGTAQDLSTASDVWMDTYDLASESDVLAPLLTRPKTGKGSEQFGIKDPQNTDRITGQYRVKAANRRGGRGARQVKLVLLDEIREQQTWDAWGAITKTTNAVTEAMVLCTSNAGDASSVVLRYLRMMCHKALGDPDGICAEADPTLLLDDSTHDADEMSVSDGDDSIGLFEWSAEPGADVNDRDAWRQANPSLGWTISERTLASDVKTDPEWVFRPECLCQWVDGSVDGPFPPGTWDAGHVDADKDAVLHGDIHAGVEVSWDRSKACIAYAGLRDDGKPEVQIVAYRSGTAWVSGWLTSDERTVKPVRVMVQPSAPAGSIIEDLRSAGVPVEEWSGSMIGQDCGKFFDFVVGQDESDEPCGDLRHLSHSVLDVAAATAVTAPLSTGSWCWDRKKSPVDIGPLVAATQAVGSLMRPADKPFRSRYENDSTDLVFV